MFRGKCKLLELGVICAMVLGQVPLLHCKKGSVEIAYSGFFYANDCGESHGGFEWAAEYSARLEIQGDSGTLIITLQTGVGDLLQPHIFAVSEFSAGSGELRFRIEGSPAVLAWTEIDTVWGGRFNRHYSANRSGNAAEAVGTLPIAPFTGFAAHFYVELRLKPE